MTANKIDIWTPIISIVGVVLIIFFSINVISNKETKQKLKQSIANEIKLLKEIEVNSQKIDSLQIEISKRDSFISKITLENFTLEQFQKKYEKDIDRISILSIDDNIKFFSGEIGN